jgi:hypothetical protein
VDAPSISVRVVTKKLEKDKEKADVKKPGSPQGQAGPDDGGLM